MSKQRLFFDHDSSDRALVRALTADGHDCLVAADVGMKRTPDPEILSFAATENRVVVTANKGDFEALHGLWRSNGREHAGIIIAQKHLTLGARLARLRFLFEYLEGAEMRNRLERLSGWPEK